MAHFRFHVVSLPHTQVTKEYITCAYTQKVLNFCKMMKSRGHEVMLYASEDCDVAVDEHITCITKDEQAKHFGNNDYKKEFYKISWDENLPYWKVMNENAAEEIKKRIKPGDFVCLIGGVCQKPIADKLPGATIVEFGIGYQGFFSDFKVFESYAWMHYTYGLQVGYSPPPPPGQNKRFENGQAFDVVIPNYFDKDDFPKLYEKEDYYLYIGRFIPRKGAHIAVELTGKTGKKLIMAGQGVTEIKDGRIIGTDMEVYGEHIKHIGTVSAAERSELMGKAKAVLVPTQYIEPFAGVHIEAMLCGTPVITTDWGVFPETVVNGFNGYRCRTMGEMMKAVEDVNTLDSAKIRDYAMRNYTLDRVSELYQAYFEQLATLDGEGWYSPENFSQYKRYEKV
jgi:glycosyltransferase involved in cell wall biosynthesis